MTQKIKHRPDVGAVLLRILNGLKHTPQTLGLILGIDSEELEKVIQGKASLSAEIEAKLVSVRGINQRDFYPRESQHLFPVKDDTNEGVVICRREDTNKSQRTISRGPDQVPYYIYGDMAMSNLSSIKPEWIKQLYVHNGENPDLPDWAFNKGHFEHQMTYFIGPVNFHWKGKDGQKHVCKMNTGDTNYIVPFVPHSFTTRRKGEGLILAITYEGVIAGSKFQSTIFSLSIENYLREIRRKMPVLSEDNKNVDGVITSRHFDADIHQDEEGNYKLAHLINPSCQPNTAVSEFLLNGSVSYRTFHDCWGYNIGSRQIILKWDEGSGLHKSVLKQDDSFFVKPSTPFDFLCSERGKFIIFHTLLQQGDPYTELALIDKYVGEEGLKRVHTETTRWY